jgi:hypothetical protein
MAYTKYSLTPADNNAAPPNGAPEGMLPSGVNDTMRDMMSQIRDVGDGIRGGTYTMTAPVITGGSITGAALSGNTFTNPVITGGSINNTPIGATTANTGRFSDLTDTGLTSGRVIYAGTGGNLVDDADFTFNGTTVTMANDASISGLTVGRGGGAIGGNTAVGLSALNVNSTGSNNFAGGGYSLVANTTGSNNTATGTSVLQNNTTGGNNTANGYQSLFSNTTASNNTALGYKSLYGNTTGAQNIGVGYQAGDGITTGVYNVCLGFSAGNFGATLTTGTQNIYIGTNSGPTSSSVSNELLISCVNSQGKGGSTGFINANGGGVFQGNNSSSWSTTSDRRLKKNIVDNTDGLNKITAIQVRNFEYRLPEEVDAELKSGDAVKRTGVQLGVIAQELQQVLPECVKQETTGVLTVDTDNLTWYLINAVKELKAEIDQLKGN